MRLARWIDWTILVICLICGVVVMRAQARHSGSIERIDDYDMGGSGCKVLRWDDGKYVSGPCENSGSIMKWKIGPNQNLYLGKPEPQAETELKSICGTDSKQHTANIDLLQISCVDYDALAKVAPQIPWPSGARTQVLIHVRAGDVARITVGGVTKYADIGTDSWGRRIAMVQFAGHEHTSVEVKVYTEIKE